MKTFLRILLLQISVATIKTESHNVTCQVGRKDPLISSARVPSGVYVLDFNAPCVGVVRTAYALFQNPGQGVDLNSNMVISLVVYRMDYSINPPSLYPVTGNVTATPSSAEQVEDSQLVRVDLVSQRLPIIDRDRIGIHFTLLESVTASLYLTTEIKSFSDPLTDTFKFISFNEIQQEGPIVWFDIVPGRENDSKLFINNTFPTGPSSPTEASGHSSTTVVPPTEASHPQKEEENTANEIATIATIVAVILAVLACIALAVTLGVTFCKRKGHRSRAHLSASGCEEGVYSGPGGTIQSRHCIKRISSTETVPISPYPRASIDSLNVESNKRRFFWTLAATSTFTSSDLPNILGSNTLATPPFPTPNYEQQFPRHLKTCKSVSKDRAYDIPEGERRPNCEEYDDIVDCPYEVPPSKEDKIYAYLKRKELLKAQRDQLKITSYLGHGNFADIHKATWTKPWTGEVTVATKTLVSKSSVDKLRFLQEAHIMAQFAHINIVKIHAVLAESEPVIIVLELLQGDLRKFLMEDALKLVRCNTDEAQLLFLKFAREISSGMKYLSKKCFIHRDLAARNVLLTDTQMCKIADFGLARDLSTDGVYQSQGGSIPVKWTAPEALCYGSYTSASDVWSYSVVLFEIWSLGQKPYRNIRNEHVLGYLESGQRLHPPPGCPKSIYSIMIDCWNPVPGDRPTFGNIEDLLSGDDEELLDCTPEDVDLADEYSCTLGSNMSTSAQLYPTLQNKYI